MKNSVHDNGGFIGRVADYASEDYYTVLQQGSAYEVANATYTNVSIATGSTGNLGVVFSADGTKVYFQSANNNTTKFATLSTPSDLSTASSLTSVSSGNGSQSITFNPTGTKVYHTAYSGGIYFASLSTAWDLTTRGSETAISSGISQPRDLQFNNDGTKLYVIRSGSIYSFPLASAYTITSTDVASSNRTTQSLTGGDQQGFRFNSDGTKLFAIHGNGYSSNLTEYTLSTAYDITTIGSATIHTTTASQVSDAHDFTFSHDGTKFYVVGVNSSNVHEYTTTNTVNANKKNTGVWSMDADYLNAELASSALDIDTVFGTTYLREFTSFPSTTFASGSGGSGTIDVTFIFDMTFSTTDTGCILDQGGSTDGLYVGTTSGGNLRLSVSGAVSGVSNETSTTTTDMSAYAGVAGQLIVTIDYQNHIQCWWNDSTNGINQIVSVDFNGNGDWAGTDSARVGSASASNTAYVFGGQDVSAFTGTITRYREITTYVDTSTF